MDWSPLHILFVIVSACSRGGCQLSYDSNCNTEINTPQPDIENGPQTEPYSVTLQNEVMAQTKGIIRNDPSTEATYSFNAASFPDIAAENSSMHDQNEKSERTITGGTLPITTENNMNGGIILEELRTTEKEIQNITNDSTTSEQVKNTRSRESDSTVRIIIGQIDGISVLDTSIKVRLPNLVDDEYVAFDSVDYIYNDSLIFYTANSSIIKATFDEELTLSNKETIVNIPNSNIARLALDWVNKKLYWIEENTQCVMKSDLDGKNRISFVENPSLNFIYPNNIAVDPYEGLVFFVSNYSVYKTNVTGYMELVLIDGNEPGIRGRGVRTLALDRLHKQLYISGENHPESEYTHYLARVNYDGADMEELPMEKVHDVYSMDVFNGTVYFAHYEANSTSDELLSVSADSQGTAAPSKLFRPRKYYQSITSVKVYHPCVQNPDCELPVL